MQFRTVHHYHKRLPVRNAIISYLLPTQRPNLTLFPNEKTQTILSTNVPPFKRCSTDRLGTFMRSTPPTQPEMQSFPAAPCQSETLFRTFVSDPPSDQCNIASLSVRNTTQALNYAATSLRCCLIPTRNRYLSVLLLSMQCQISTHALSLSAIFAPMPSFTCTITTCSLPPLYATPLAMIAEHIRTKRLHATGTISTKIRSPSQRTSPF